MQPAILVHGGAGIILEEDRAEACAKGCLGSARLGYQRLQQGGSALEAVEAAVMTLEDNPRFNAGTGAALNSDGVVEHDAMVMNGADLGVGAVAALQGFAHPIQVARAVMERSPHALFCGPGAARFAREAGFENIPMAALSDESGLRRWRKERDENWPRRPGTVGAVAIDAEGHVASATSTGGISGKLPGRVGDSPLPGSGGYADATRGAASTTGEGEAILKILMAERALQALARLGDPTKAAQEAVEALGSLGALGGVILVDLKGRLGFAFNTPRMSRAWVDGSGEGAGFE